MIHMICITDKWILAQKLRIPKINSQTTWNSRRRKTKVWILQSFLERKTKYPWKKLQRQSVEQRLKEWPSRDYPWDPPHIQSQNPETIVDANKCLLAGAWYSCPLKVSASTWQIQKEMLTAIHWIEHGVPQWSSKNKDTRNLKGLQPHRRNNNMNKPVPELPRAKPPTKEYTWLDSWL